MIVNNRYCPNFVKELTALRKFGIIDNCLGCVIVLINRYPKEKYTPRLLSYKLNWSEVTIRTKLRPLFNYDIVKRDDQGYLKFTTDGQRVVNHILTAGDRIERLLFWNDWG